MLDDLSRRKIFYLLKRYSSLTLWARFFEARKPLYEAIKKMVTEHPQNDPDQVQIRLYKASLDDHVNFQRGLQALAVGDRSVFRDHEEGFLYQVARHSASTYITSLLNRGDCPDEWSYLGDLAQAARDVAEGARGTLEADPGEPAEWNPNWILQSENLPKHPLPEPLPPVPDAPEPPLLVRTGEEVPVDGIYDPEVDGTCMNYLLGGTAAPTVTREYGELRESKVKKGRFIRSIEHIPTTWRLIWEDHRYEDGTIPEEEKDYFAPLPEPAPQESQVKGRALPGESCTRPGFWWTPAKQGSRRRFEREEVFPDFPYSQYGHTIWYFDQNQD